MTGVFQSLTKAVGSRFAALGMAAAMTASAALPFNAARVGAQSLPVNSAATSVATPKENAVFHEIIVLNKDTVETVPSVSKFLKSPEFKGKVVIASYVSDGNSAIQPEVMKAVLEARQVAVDTKFILVRIHLNDNEHYLKGASALHSAYGLTEAQPKLPFTVISFNHLHNDNLSSFAHYKSGYDPAFRNRKGIIQDDELLAYEIARLSALTPNRVKIPEYDLSAQDFDKAYEKAAELSQNGMVLFAPKNIPPEFKKQMHGAVISNMGFGIGRPYIKICYFNPPPEIVSTDSATSNHDKISKHIILFSNGSSTGEAVRFTNSYTHPQVFGQALSDAIEELYPTSVTFTKDLEI